MNALIVLAVAIGAFLWTMGREEGPMPNAGAVPATGYMGDIIHAGAIAVAFWGIVGLLAGTYVAFQLAFPALNCGEPAPVVPSPIS